MDLMDLGYAWSPLRRLFVHPHCSPVLCHVCVLRTVVDHCRHKRASLAEGVRRIPAEKEVMLLPVKQDALIPAQELEYLASLLGAQVMLNPSFPRLKLS